jgi:hypothetical protein
MYEELHDLVLDELTDLLLYVRKIPIVGLRTKKLRSLCFEPFGGPELFNRRALLLLSEIEAHNAYVKMPIDEEKFDREYELSGLKRP